jgi:signal transduction histidine kinase
MVDAATPATRLAHRRQGRVFTLAAMTVAATLAAIWSAWYISEHDSLLQPVSTGILRGIFVFAWAVTGVYTWWRRPDSRLGPLGFGVAGVFALSSLNGSPSALAYTLGMTVWAFYIVYLAYVYLSFPADHLGADLDRRLFAGLAIATIVLWALILLFADRLPIGGPFTDCSARCPDNALQVFDSASSLGHALASLFTVVTTAALIGVALILFLKTRAPSRLRRRTLEPVMYLVVASVLSFLLYRVVGSASPGTKTPLRYLCGAVSIAVPVAFLVGQIRGRIFAATRVGQLVAAMQDTAVTPARVEALMRDALGDPTLTLALSAPENGSYIGVDGVAFDLPAATADQQVTPIVRAGSTVAVLVHDSTLDTDPAVLEGLAASSFMLLENARLVDELRASRGRIATAAEQERLRLERDLHDGAQQRLMAIQIKLALLRDRISEDDVASELDEISDDATAAVEELRGLAHGIYPTVLRERGLADGLGVAAASSPLPVQIVDGGIGRCDPTIEAAIYFCSLEAIQNATKHGGPGTRVTVTLERRHAAVEVEVVDDGVGFQTGSQADGIGLVSMRDRIAAVGGELSVRSAPGTGTTVHAVVPVG